MEEEFVQNQERLKPQEERNEEERTKVNAMSLLPSFCFFFPSFSFLKLHLKSQGSDSTQDHYCEKAIDH